MDYESIIAAGNPSQSHWELNQLINLIPVEDMNRVLEIGVHRGGSLIVWRDVFEPELLIGIDNKVLDEARIDGAVLIEGNSQEKRVFDQVVSLLGDQKLDFLFIDGGHLYGEVKADFDVYSPLVRPGGFVGFHDVVIQDNSSAEVYLFWEDIKKKYRTCTFWDGTPSGTGEGLLWI